MTLEVEDVCMSLGDVARYIGRSPQQVSRYVAAGLLRKKDARSVALHQFNRFLGRKFPRLPRFESVADFDGWVSGGRRAAQ